MDKVVKVPKKINVKFSKKITENIIKANQLANHFEKEYKKADEARNILIQSVLLASTSLESLEGYQLNVDLDKGEATLTK